MITRDAIQEKYVVLLRAHIDQPAEQYLAAAADLGRELLLADVPIEDVVEIHQKALVELDEELSDASNAELINQAFGPLMEMFMAYSLAMRERAEEHERARRSDQQLIEAQNVELQQEIVERKQISDALRESQERYHHLVENTSDWIWEVDQDAIYTYASPAVKDLLGYEPEEIIGRTPFDLMADDEAERIAEAFGEMAQSAQRFAGLENTNIHKDGREVVLETSGVPIVDDAGNLLGYQGIDRDITERKQAEETLQEAYDNWQNTFDAVQDLITIIDRDGHIVQANQATHEAFADTEVQGTCCYELFHGRADPIPDCPALQAFETGQPVHAEISEPHLDDHWFDIYVYPVPAPDGSIQQVVHVLRDITERKQAQQELEDYAARLEAANEELEAFSYSVSHDLRAPLRGMDGFSQALLEDYADQFDEQGKDYLQRVRTASQRMARLIDDLLELSRITHSKMRVEGVNLSEIAEQSAADLHQPEPNRQVEFVIAPGLAVKGDEPLLRAAVQELLVNAWKYTSTRQQATIEFGATQQDGETVYFVRDNGIGFDMAYADKLFGAFQRLHNDEQFPGTGIGLVTVQRIIHRHGGHVWAEATEDEGATFYFTV